VNGLVTEALGHLPTPGECVTIDDFEFEVEDVRRRALVSTLARRLRPEMHGEERA
jgi:Mg2+/Co2+ transporter CorC